MIKGIFYARFFPKEGTKIVAQSPPGCIVPESNGQASLLDFALVQEYMIPRKAFYHRIMTVTDPTNRYTVLGFPVSIASARYERNEFIFNFGLVVAAGTDHAPYEPVVRRLAITFTEMEKQNRYLSRGDKATTAVRSPTESLLAMVKEDLNNYGECMIAVDEANTINVKLFPHRPPPPPVRDWHVPVATMRFGDVVDPTWDPTLQRVAARIDGVNDVHRIAHLADVSPPLARLAVAHLLYYDAVLLLDIFLFGACYAPRPGVHRFVANEDGVVDECARYVCYASDPAHSPPSHHLQPPDPRPLSSRSAKASLADGAVAKPVSNYLLVKLMTTFCPGKSVAEWLKDHMDAGVDVLGLVDVRRLVQFGIIKGYLYRVHKYAVSEARMAAGLHSNGGGDGASSLWKYVDGNHCFDQIMIEMSMTDADIMEELKQLRPCPMPAWGGSANEDVAIIWK